MSGILKGEFAGGGCVHAWPYARTDSERTLAVQRTYGYGGVSATVCHSSSVMAVWTRRVWVCGGAALLFARHATLCGAAWL